jgi:hypothetical protein
MVPPLMLVGGGSGEPEAERRILMRTFRRSRVGRYLRIR